LGQLRLVQRDIAIQSLGQLEEVADMRMSISGRAMKAVLATVAVLCGWVASVGTVQAQSLPAGVKVDAEGVLRLQRFQDPTGELTRRRLAEVNAKFGKAGGSNLRKVSLNRLEEAVTTLTDKGAPATEEMKNLAGITRVQYIFYYPDTKDIVLAGPAEPYVADLSGRMIGAKSGRAVLQLEDLVVALRSFPPTGEATQVIGVSIDPTAEGLQNMRQFLVDISGRVRPGDADAIVANLREKLGLQNVSVQGISPKTHFAQVLVEADYRMKLIGIGMEQAPVKITSYVERANPRDVSRNAMQRWFFTPNYECVRMADDKLAMELVGEGVKLIGENEMVQQDGSRIGVGGGNRASEMFCSTFTQNYPQLAQKAPVYAQMRNLIDLSVAAAFIQQQDFYGQADWKMVTFGDEEKFAVETYETPKTVETACTAIWKGNTLMTPVGGGVHIEPKQALEPKNLVTDELSRVSEVREKTKLDGLAGGQWWWD
jgi:hypothetical protein